MARLGPARIEILRYAFIVGHSASRASLCAGVSIGTAYNWFSKFRSRGLKRGDMKRRPSMRRHAFWRAPRYTGPVWIGKAIDTDSRM